MKLISMTDFVLEQIGNHDCNTNKDSEYNDLFVFKNTIENYAKFLKQPLTIGMFVPCDRKGNFLTEPKTYQDWLKAMKIDEMNCFAQGYGGCAKFDEAKERVLFEGKRLDKYEVFEDCVILNDRIIFSKSGKVFAIHKSEEYKTVEGIVSYDLEITPTALKQIGL